MNTSDYTTILYQLEQVTRQLANLCDVLDLAICKLPPANHQVNQGFDDPSAELNKSVQQRLEHYATEPIKYKCLSCGSDDVSAEITHDGMKISCYDCGAILLGKYLAYRFRQKNGGRE